MDGFIKIICPNCKKKMLVDDIDFRFMCCQNEYHICVKCNISAFVKVRYSVVRSVEFQDADGNKI